jgi:hypothetical protein
MGSCFAARVSAACVVIAVAIIGCTVVPKPKTQPAQAAPSAGSRLDITIRDVLWQELPRAVRQAVLSPDGRVWYVLASARKPGESGPVDVPVVRGDIEREFRQPDPQIIDAVPALFEPSGRTWFITTDHSKLLGYDGKAWVERSPSPEAAFTGWCPGHPGTAWTGGYNLALSDCALFPDTDGVHRFDLISGNWSYQAMSGAHERVGFAKEFPDRRRPPELLPSPDEDGAFAFIGQAAQPLWRYRDGRWAPFPLPRKMELADQSTFAAGAHCIWLDNGNGGIYRFPMRGAEDAGAPLRPNEPSAEDWEHEDSLRFGDWNVAEGVVLHGELDGTLLVSSLNLWKRGQDFSPFKPGVVIVPPPAHGKNQADRSPRALFGDGPASGKWDMWGEFGRAGSSHECQQAFASAPWRDDARSWSIWLGGLQPPWLAGFPHGPRRRIDVPVVPVAGQPPIDDHSHPLSDPGLQFIHVVKSDGTMFVTFHDPAENGDLPLLVHRPGMPDDRKVLQGVSAQLTAQMIYCIASDGMVWACLAGEKVKEDRLARFDGRAWQTIKTLPDRASIAAMEPGTHGEMLVEFEFGDTGVQRFSYTLYAAAGNLVDSDLFHLIEAHKADFVRAFSGDRLGLAGAGGCPIAVDAAGNVWADATTSYEKFKVLVGDHWLDAHAPLWQARPPLRLGQGQKGPPAGAFAVRDIRPVGKGAQISADGFIGGVEGNEVHFERGPSSYGSPRWPRQQVQDAGGGLWLEHEEVSADFVGASARGDWLRGHSVCRIAGSKQIEKYDRVGIPQLADQAGNVWLVAFDGLSRSRIDIWHDGRLETTELPDTSADTALISDRADSLYVWNVTGLHHYTLPDPAKPAGLKHDAVYAVELPGGMRSRRVQYSALGYLVTDSEQGNLLYLVPKRKEPAAWQGRTSGSSN